MTQQNENMDPGSKSGMTKVRYNPKEIEKKWQAVWKEAGIYKFHLSKEHRGKSIGYSAKSSPLRPKPKALSKYYTLVELPYPSGDLHIGHWFTFVAPDVLSRFKRMQGYNVFFPMGYDAFGLPAENAAIKRGVHPKDWTEKNIESMTKQFETMGTMIDWDHVTITCRPEYYKWNQWIFQKMYEKGLAYRGKTLSNWCPTDQTVLANEHVENGKCWRCGDTVVQKEVEQWFLRITDYAERLLWPEQSAKGIQQSIRQAQDKSAKSKSDNSKSYAQSSTLRQPDWPTSVQAAQNDWIGRSEGVQLEFKIQNSKSKIEVFTTALDTVFGVSFIVLAPEHPLVEEILKQVQDDKIRNEVERYIKEALEKTERDRLIETKDKTGVFTGVYVINPFNNSKVPVWIADYVLMNYGTGAVMGVPGHDERDHEFAQKFNLPITFVVKPTKEGANVEKDGFWSYSEIKSTFKKDSALFSSGEFNGLSSREAKEKMTEWIEKESIGKRKIQYHLRDWSVSRQRYWGTPVPMIDCPTCGIVPVPEKDLPVTLPYDVDYQPKGKAPLASNEEWLHVTCPTCGQDATRDPETLDTFFDSAWYYYRYTDPTYNQGPFDKLKVKELLPVDIYFGGGEHTLGHTLYARFFTKFFHDQKMVDFDEFALKRIQHGIVLGPDGNKMSKSKGNVINPDDVVKEFGTDAVRVYLSFMMPYQATGPWSTTAMYGSYRFLKRVWELQNKCQMSNVKCQMSNEDEYHMHKTIKKVTEDVSRSDMNTAVAALMEWLNYLEAKAVKGEVSSSTPEVGKLQHENHTSGVLLEEYKTLLLLLAPFAPHMTEELYQRMKDKGLGIKAEEKKSSFTSIHQEPWPTFDPSKIIAETVTVAVQVNGKLRETLQVPSEKSNVQSEVEALARKLPKLQPHLQGKTVKKIIYVPGKILNFVVE